MNLGLIAPIPSDGTSFYRAHGPFAYLSRETGLHIIEADVWDWTNLARCDVVFLQRPYTDAHVMVAKTCKAMNVPLWVDYDDLYGGFPNYTHHQQTIYGNESALTNSRRCIDLADVVTVSTGALVKHTRPDAVIIPNGFNTYIWPFSDAPRDNVITWRGSGGHLGDLDPVIPALESVRRDYPDWSFHFLGSPHYKCFDIGKVHAFTDLFSYMAQFHALRPSIHIVPLCDNEFNRCKSNIAWLEATAAGAVTIAPDWEEWSKPGVMTYSGNFENTMRAAIESKNRMKNLGESRLSVFENYCLNDVNRKRLEILKRFAP